MAELPKNIRKVGGEMVAARSPFTRRVLLPTEADLCNALGITEEEYFQFLEGVATKVKEQPEAYGLVPEIFAGPGAGALARAVARARRHARGAHRIRQEAARRPVVHLGADAALHALGGAPLAVRRLHLALQGGGGERRAVLWIEEPLVHLVCVPLLETRGRL